MSRHPSHRPTIDELRLGDALAAVIFASAHVVRPAHDTVHPRAGIPLDVGDRWFAPLEGKVSIDADHRDLFGRENAFVGEVFLGGVEEEGLVDDQGRGRGDPEQFIEHSAEALGAVLPDRQVVRAGR